MPDIEDPALPPDPVVIPGQDAPNPAPEPEAPPLPTDPGPDVGPVELPDGPGGDGGLVMRA